MIVRVGNPPPPGTQSNMGLRSMNKFVSTVSRRTFLAGTAGILAAPMIIRSCRAAAKSNTVTYVGYGGSFQENEEKTVLKPFTEETGINVNVVIAPELARVKAQLLAGNVEWDIYMGGGANVMSGAKRGFWQDLNLSMIDVPDLFIPPTSNTIMYDISAMGIAWNPERHGPGKHPTTFAEFFDLEKFPGRRCILKTSPDGRLEMALLADGVAPKDMYPLDVERALKALDRIKSNTVWAAATPQTVSLLQSGEADFSFTFSNRVKATTEPGGGVPLAFSSEQNILSANGMAILKNAPNAENAMKLISYFMRPEVQARENNVQGLLPTSRKGLGLMSAGARKWLPDMNNPTNLTMDQTYWRDNYEQVSIRYKEWFLG